MELDGVDQRLNGGLVGAAVKRDHQVSRAGAAGVAADHRCTKANVCARQVDLTTGRAHVFDAQYIMHRIAIEEHAHAQCTVGEFHRIRVSHSGIAAHVKQHGCA